MTTYDVLLHTHTGRRYLVSTDEGEVEAQEIARFKWAEEGDEGELVYDEIETVEITQI